ncbi:carboxypeptidase-like regulatory domain-containing protein [Lutimonas sp.]|uniref:carboxypeptidase-like regulatory domain-containing protein n=1 Tax=Lutimonas sp. TaxID=1872403 RepID=UPI003C7746A7
MEPKFILLIILKLSCGFVASAQTEIIGRVVDHISGSYLKDVRIGFEDKEEYVFTDEGGYFSIKNHAQNKVVLSIEYKGYKKLRIPVKLNSTLEQLDLGSLEISRMDEVEMKNEWVELNEFEPEVDQYEVENVAGILNAGKDLFSRTAAYDFGSNFFRPRFLGTEHGTVMLNGVVLNKIYTGRPEWSNWGGLNDALRQQEKYAPMQGSPYNLGGLSYGINMISKASTQQKGFKFSSALSNKNYQSRIMITFASGALKQGWSYMLSGSFRFGDEGFRSGTNYRGYSFLASVDKQLGDRHHLNTTFIYAFNSRGKSSPMTQEVYNLKGIAYNSYWGFQQDQKRNSREKRILEPIFQLNHQYHINGKTIMYNHFTYQYGTMASSRLDYGGARLLKEGETIVGGGMNPDPTYYQKLPSYFLRDPNNPDFGRAYLAEREFRENGQVNWNELYAANMNSPFEDNAVYTLYDDQQDSKFWSLNSGFSTKFGHRFSMFGNVFISRSTSERYAYMQDLLGGKGYLDVDSFTKNSLEAQSDLRNPNRIVVEHEKFGYNYQLDARQFGVYVNANYSSKKTDLFLGVEFVSLNFRRNGLFENGAFPGPLSFGKSKTIAFQPLGLKTGFLHKFNGRHIVLMNANYLEKAPILNHVFSNVRVSNEAVKGLKICAYKGLDLKYVWRHTHFSVMLSGYYLMLTDESKISFYYADGLTGLENAASSAYVQEVLTGIDKQNTGLEFSVEVPLWINVKLKAVAALGRSVYASDPELYLSSNAFEGSLDLGKAFLKGYYAAGGPQHAYSIGLEYSSPNYWWISGSCNFFDKSFVSVAPITRTRNFFLDTDGSPIHDLDPKIAEDLLDQESLPAYLNFNLVGGKSWKIKNWYLGLFASVNNLSNSLYKTGGFEQSRTANYLTLKEDKTRENPLFGPKYWFGFGTTFFTSLYIRL